VIQEASVANSFKQLFLNIWDEGMVPKLGFDYKPNHSFYNSIDFFVAGKQVIIFPDKDARESYRGMDKDQMQVYLTDIYDSNKEYFNSSDYLIGFIWSFQGSKMLDLWQFALIMSMTVRSHYLSVKSLRMELKLKISACLAAIL